MGSPERGMDLMKRGGQGHDTLGRLLAELCNTPGRKRGALQLEAAMAGAALKEYVEQEGRILVGEAFTRFMNDLYTRVFGMINSHDPGEKVGGVVAIDALIDVSLVGENATKIARFANYLRDVFQPSTDYTTMVLSARALGHLVRTGGPMTADVVTFEVRRALEWLRGDRVESRRFAAVHLLRELANNAPTVFNVHVSQFIVSIWSALRDPKLIVRETAVGALRACLVVVEKRETRYRVKWYYELFEETKRGARKSAGADSIHGSLLALGELLRHTGEFMLARYREVVDMVLQYCKSRDKLVRQSVANLIPKLAHFAPERFAKTYLGPVMQYLLAAIRSPTERGIGFKSLGNLAIAFKKVRSPAVASIEAQLPLVANLIQEAISVKRGKPVCPEAIEAAGALAEGLQDRWAPYAGSLLYPLVSTGLSPTLVSSLERMSRALPDLSSSICDNLLEMITKILAQDAASHQPPPGKVAPDTDLKGLALSTLGSFDFGPRVSLEFIKDSVAPFLEDRDQERRERAALTSAYLLERCIADRSAALSQGSPLTKQGQRIVELVLAKVLLVAIADINSGVRVTILKAFVQHEAFDAYLSQADALRALFIALNDQVCAVREHGIAVVGRLSKRNPAYVLPTLRKLLLQLLANVEHGADWKQKEESAWLLGHLIRSSPRLTLPYVFPILKTLVAKLKGQGTPGSGGGSAGVTVAILSTVGDLAEVGRTAMLPHMKELLPLVIESLQDGSASDRRAVAVTTLRKLVASTGYVMSPYNEFPALLSLLLRLVSESNPATRLEVIKVLGVVGAIDPHTNKMNQITTFAGAEADTGRAQKASGNAGDGAGVQALGRGDHHKDVLPLTGIATSSEEYYPTLAINALMQILNDSSMASHHHMVIRSLMFVFQSLSITCVQYMPKVMPMLFRIMRTCDDDLRKSMFQQLILMVSIVRQHIRKYLPDLMGLIYEYWNTASLLVPILKLIEQLSQALRDDFYMQLPDLLPHLVNVLSEAERTGNYSNLNDVFHTFEAFGSSIEDYFHLILPSLARLFCSPTHTTPIAIRRLTLQSVKRILHNLKLNGYASAILQPLCHVLREPNELLRLEAMEVIVSAAHALEGEFVLYIPTIKTLMAQHKMHHEGFEVVAARLQRIFESKQVHNSLNDAKLSELSLGVYDQNGSVVHTPVLSPLRGMENDGPGGSKGPLLGQNLIRLTVNEKNLKKAWECSQRSTKEDWVEWMRQFSVELLRESPSPALRACYTLAQVQPHVARELFAAGFVSCWNELKEKNQQELLRSLEAAFGSPTIPPEIVTTLLNLAEFMEHDEKPLPVDIRTLGALAEKCHVFAKALHYKEREFLESPEDCVEALISIYNQLRQPEAALGVLMYVQEERQMELKETWYEKLERWDDALNAYEAKATGVPTQSMAYLEAKLGSMRCLAALAEWEKLGDLCNDMWITADASLRRELAPTAALAAWNLNQWDDMEQYVSMLYSGSAGRSLGGPSPGTGTGIGTMIDVTGGGAFLQAVLSIRSGEYQAAKVFIEQAREELAAELTALVGESYERAYPDMVRVQQINELEEVIEYSTAKLTLSPGDAAQRCGIIYSMWKDRLAGAQKNVQVWQALLSVRSLVLSMSEDAETWMKFASLCRKSGRVRQSKKTLVQLLKYDPETITAADVPGYGGGSGQPYAMFAFLKHMWATGASVDAYDRLQDLSKELVANRSHLAPPAAGDAHKPPLLARVYLKLGLWKWALIQSKMDDENVSTILSNLKVATELARSWAKAWHNWAYFNVAALDFYQAKDDNATAVRHVAPAVLGFFRSIALGQATANRRGNSVNLQDILRLLTLWFNHGYHPDVRAALEEGFGHVSIDTWLVVIPQIIARVHSSSIPVRELIQQLLIRIGRHHPQALMYPLLVATKSSSTGRRAAAMTVLDSVRQHSAPLVEQAQLVSQELIRIAVLWHESWHEALEEASRLYFGENNVNGMLNCLLPKHLMLEKQGPETIQEIAFVQAYGRELTEAHEWCNKYRVSRKDSELHQAWDLYYHVFKRINKQLPSLTTLQLQYVAPALVRAQNLELAVPGTYAAGEPVVPITSFVPTLHVITSKQRPRKLTINGGDGNEYQFLLKGHEDLRQDERVMQLFGLVNTLLVNDVTTAERNLSISRYAVIPLSPNSGLIGWVPNTDTLHALIREYREARKIPLNVEHRLMVAMAPDYEHLPLINKVEVFEHALASTPGDDLNKVLWLKSFSSEVWLDWRTNYNRSLAVMSMVGYLLGLGDRHPSNLMIDRYTGKVVHIDFGDCFEASMNRDKFPEKIPFRLTRMLVKAMGVSGVEGNFTYTCENVMRVLRSNRDSVMAMLEAFVHDPLMNWRLIFTDTDVQEVIKKAAEESADGAGGPAAPEAAAPANRSQSEKDLMDVVGNMGAATEALNERAVQVMQRLSDKLTGRDGQDGDISVQAQVKRLIAQATSNENLCQSYIGWCSFW